MGYKEAKEDGIRTWKNPKTKDTCYYPKCCVCGNEVFSLGYQRGREYTCQTCKDQLYFTEKASRVDRSNEAKDRKFANAVKRIEVAAGPKRFKDYEYAIQTVEKKLYREGWFDSTEEIMVAIELIKSGIRARHQVKVSKYRVDFVLPDQKIILEVDGHIFHTKETREREKVRDNILILAFGADWEVVHITDDRINEDITKLTPAMKRIVSKRKLLRRDFKGELPKWYSDRE